MDATASRPPDLRYSKLHFIPEFAFIFGLSIGYFVGRYFSNEYHTHADASEIFKALTKIPTTKIPKENMYCTGAIEGDIDVTVGDFISEYLAWSSIQKVFSYRSITCEGNTIKQCVWSFGGNHGFFEEGWVTFLKFKYDTNSKSVLPTSLACETIP